MDEYELLLHRREQDFREIEQLFAKFLVLTNGIHQEISLQQPIYPSLLPASVQGPVVQSSDPTYPVTDCPPTKFFQELYPSTQGPGIDHTQPPQFGPSPKFGRENPLPFFHLPPTRSV